MTRILPTPRPSVPGLCQWKCLFGEAGVGGGGLFLCSAVGSCQRGGGSFHSSLLGDFGLWVGKEPRVGLRRRRPGLVHTQCSARVGVWNSGP